MPTVPILYGLYRYEGIDGTLDDLHRHITSKLSQEKGWIVQPCIRSNPAWRASSRRQVSQPREW